MFSQACVKNSIQGRRCMWDTHPPGMHAPQAHTPSQAHMYPRACMPHTPGHVCPLPRHACPLPPEMHVPLPRIL